MSRRQRGITFCGIKRIKSIKPKEKTKGRNLMSILRIYTDGGCAGNQSDENLGGWGALLEFGDTQKELYGSEANTTNNRMELTAVIEALKALKRDGVDIEVFSDSSYVANCFRERWYESWEKNNWKNAARKSVENQDLWKELLALVRKHNVKFFRVKGHVSFPKGTADNEIPHSAALDKLYEKFVQWNGARFTYEDFIYITRMNNLVDGLANKGIDEIR